MEAFSKFIESEAFFPVLILLLVMLLAVFVWVLLSGKSDERKRRNKNRVVDESAEIKIVQEDIVNIQAKEKISNLENKKSKQNLPLVDIPINVMDETPIEIEKIPEIEKDEITKDEELINEIEKELVSIPVIEDDSNNKRRIVPEDIAFNSLPIDDNKINDNIKIEEKKEYDGNKTEIFDFPDFDMNENEEKSDEENTIEKDIIDAANKYIESIMSNR